MWNHVKASEIIRNQRIQTISNDFLQFLTISIKFKQLLAITKDFKQFINFKQCQAISTQEQQMLHSMYSDCSHGIQRLPV